MKENMLNKSQNNSCSGYEIRVRNHLDKYWSAFFVGWSITNIENGEVILTISNIDQAGLYGALNRIRDLNLTLVSVKRTKKEDLG
jgi:hypothetical protein